MKKIEITINPEIEHKFIKTFYGPVLDKEELDANRSHGHEYPPMTEKQLEEFAKGIDKAYWDMIKVANKAAGGDDEELAEYLCENIEEEIGTAIGEYITKLTYYTNPQLTIQEETEN